MNNFTYHNPTRIVFGRGTIAELNRLVPPGHKVMITSDGRSPMQNGVYDQIRSALAGRTLLDFGGIEANPPYECLMEAVQLARRERPDLLLAVGGGSVIDGTKFVAAAVPYEGADPWDIATSRATVTSAVPLGVVLTLAATGSESNNFAVISRRATQEKFAFSSDHLYPRFAILDPSTTFSLPLKQVRNGVVDAFVHVLEQYATYPVHGTVQDRQAEALLLALLELGPQVLARTDDFDLRADLMWAANQALNGLIACGVPEDWATHRIGHELTALYGIDHAESLAVVVPALLRRQRATKAAKLEQYARRVWGVAEPDTDAAIEAGIRRTVKFFESLGMPTRLVHYGIDPADAARRVGERFTARQNHFGERADVDGPRAAEILRAC